MWGNDSHICLESVADAMSRGRICRDSGCSSEFDGDQSNETADEPHYYFQGALIPQDVAKIVFNSSNTEIPPCAFAQTNILKRASASKQIFIGRESFERSPEIFTNSAYNLCQSLGITGQSKGITSLPSLTNVQLNEGLQGIGKYAFAGCILLEKVELPSTVKLLGVGAFCHCTNLKEIILNEGLAKIPNGAFSGCIKLERIELPSSTTEIGTRAFYQCRKLMKVTLNKGIQRVKPGAFEQCSNLRTVVINEGMQRIKSKAFDHCQLLREVIINEGVERFDSSIELLHEIESDAFQHCNDLRVVRFPPISRRLKVLIEAGQRVFEPLGTGQNVIEELSGSDLLTWTGEELLGTHECISSGNWQTTRNYLNALLLVIRWHELKESMKLLELALWKAKIDDVSAISSEERQACRPGCRGPYIQAILEYLVFRTCENHRNHHEWSISTFPDYYVGVESEVPTFS